mmetsp:Transcript_168139/g.540079  ORF Transcript_168139/g.540079 Transcript_168139/m.540079 type:complete len:395 (-) Transcript_168139:247-1431(-)
MNVVDGLTIAEASFELDLPGVRVKTEAEGQQGVDERGVETQMVSRVVDHVFEDRVELCPAQGADVLCGDLEVDQPSVLRQSQSFGDVRVVGEGRELGGVDVGLVDPVHGATLSEAGGVLVERLSDHALAILEAAGALHLHGHREGAVVAVFEPRPVGVAHGETGVANLGNRLDLLQGLRYDDVGRPVRGLQLPKVQEGPRVDAQAMRAEFQRKGLGHDGLLGDEHDLRRSTTQVQGADCVERVHVGLLQRAHAVVHGDPTKDALLLARDDNRLVVAEQERGAAQELLDVFQDRLALVGVQQPHAGGGAQPDREAPPRVLEMPQLLLGKVHQMRQRGSGIGGVQGEGSNPGCHGCVSDGFGCDDRVRLAGRLVGDPSIDHQTRGLAPRVDHHAIA